MLPLMLVLVAVVVLRLRRLQHIAHTPRVAVLGYVSLIFLPLCLVNLQEFALSIVMFFSVCLSVCLVGKYLCTVLNSVRQIGAKLKALNELSEVKAKSSSLQVLPAATRTLHGAYV